MIVTFCKEDGVIEKMTGNVVVIPAGIFFVISSGAGQVSVAPYANQVCITEVGDCKEDDPEVTDDAGPICSMPDWAVE